MNDFPNPEVEIFTVVVQLPAGERAAYLAHACGADARLRQRVEALLQTHPQVGDFLEPSPREPALAPRPGIYGGEQPCDWIGRYKLLQQIGEGGCGVVYLAEQAEPVRRRVALKIIKPGMDTKSVIARFEAERQALALMDHASIAKIFDAGSTESGRPYFVMELIRGVKITEYCDQLSLTTEERLKLFIPVCQAITATAHKLACVIYHLLKYQEEFLPLDVAIYDLKAQEQRTRRLRKQAEEMGFELVARKEAA